MGDDDDGGGGGGGVDAVSKVTLKECGRQTTQWNKFSFLWREDKEVQGQKWAALSSQTPELFDSRFYFYT